MKTLKYVLISAVAMLAASCTKNEVSLVPEVIKEMKEYKLSVPLADGRKVISLGSPLSTRQMNTPQNPFLNPFKQIQVPDSAYVCGTTIFKLQKKADFSIINCVADESLKLTFVDSVRQMPGYPAGWTALWSIKPNVEDESPTVLYTRQQNHLTILLSKYVTAFGFELAPNLYNTYRFSVGFYDSRENAPVASLEQEATTPSGAKLFAVHSPRPFNVIEISFSGNEETEDHPHGFAIASIRYRLAKK
jgi:hypothetical protein